MKRNKFFVLGVLATLLIFGISFVGCDTGNGTNGNGLDTVATPTATPGTGTYSSAQTVALATTTEGATIYYTLDNSTPSASNGTAYTTPISVTIPTTLKAIAVKDGWNDSGVLMANYTKNNGGGGGGSELWEKLTAGSGTWVKSGDSITLGFTYNETMASWGYCKLTYTTTEPTDLNTDALVKLNSASSWGGSGKFSSPVNISFGGGSNAAGIVTFTSDTTMTITNMGSMYPEYNGSYTRQ